MKKFITYIHEKIVPARRAIENVALPWGCDFAFVNFGNDFDNNL